MRRPTASGAAVRAANRCLLIDMVNVWSPPAAVQDSLPLCPKGCFLQVWAIAISVARPGPFRCHYAIPKILDKCRGRNETILIAPVLEAVAGKVKNMFFIRAVFWLSLVVAFIPVNPSDLKEDQRPVSALETVGLAQSVVEDVAAFCTRNMGTCETGGQLVSQMGIKAREGARIAYTWLDKRYGPETQALAATDAVEGESTDPVETGAVKLD